MYNIVANEQMWPHCEINFKTNKQKNPQNPPFNSAFPLTFGISSITFTFISLLTKIIFSFEVEFEIQKTVVQSPHVPSGPCYSYSRRWYAFRILHSLISHSEKQEISLENAFRSFITSPFPWVNIVKGIQKKRIVALVFWMSLYYFRPHLILYGEFRLSGST